MGSVVQMYYAERNEGIDESLHEDFRVCFGELIVYPVTETSFVGAKLRFKGPILRGGEGRGGGGNGRATTGKSHPVERNKHLKSPSIPRILKVIVHNWSAPGRASPF